MALGTITIIEEVAAQGPVMLQRCTIVGDDSYPTGGTTGFEALYQAAVKAAGILSDGAGRQIVHVANENKGDADELAYDHANDKLMAFVRSTAAEVANTTDMSGTTFNVLITSR